MRAWLLVLICACGSDDNGPACSGPGDAPAAGVMGTVGSDTAAYGNFLWGENNDCPASGSAVISVTIIGQQVGGTLGMGLCFPRPDLITGPVTLSDTSKVLVESIGAQVGPCRYTKAIGMPVGTVTLGGFCTQSGAAFSISFSSAGVPVSKQCDGQPNELVTMALSGSAVVTARQ